MISLYEQIFCVFYQWSLKLNGKDFYNMYSASVMATVFIYINLTTLFTVANIFGWTFGVPQVLITVMIYVFMTIANYMYFSTEPRLKRIKNTPEYDLLGMRVGFLIIGSLTALFLTMAVGLQLKS